MPIKIVALILFLTYSVEASAQITISEDDYARAESMLSTTTRSTVYHTTLRPNWLDEDRFWYLHASPEGPEFILVDPGQGQQNPLFEHARMTEAISDYLESPEAEVDFSRFSFDPESEQIRSLGGRDKSMACSIVTYVCEPVNEISTSGIRPTAAVSPDGKYEAFRRENNLWIRVIDTDEEQQLTFDGAEDFGYATNNAGWVRNDRPVLLWSPDSKKIATFQHDGRSVGEMYMISTQIGHSELEAWKYPLPQDSAVFMIHRVIVHVEEKETVRLDMPPDYHRGTTTDHVADWDGTFLDVRWSPDSQQLAFVSSSRDHKDAWLRVANAETGEVREILHERVPTYYESGVNAENWQVFFETNEVLWYSERSNWGHLYLYDLTTGDLKHPITSGDWVVLQLRHADLDERVLYFTGAGRDGPDPYFQYLYRVSMDGSEPELLTPEEAHHVVSLSPQKKYLLDSWSRPDVPQQHAVRNLDGTIAVDLGKADISELLATDWRPPQPFSVKARDNETDLHGLLYKPSNFDPSKSYPILNYLYPGPQSGSVGTRSFVPSRGDKQALAELGFIVVEVDAMGTPGRSKSFHDAYYGNMGDNGLPDQITTIRQLAARNPWMDLDRVGIWGHSGGGYASTGAILRYPDFYKVAVSGAGNHDNRNYEDDWAEKWQGLFMENPDGTTNYDNQSNILLAGNLRGKLLLAHGLMDDNVPASNTLLLAEALVEANKDFDLVVFPNEGHGFGRGRTYWMRRRWDYFVEHLLGAVPPREYEFGRDRVQIGRPTG
ncbi:MAG: DPP IV N-terminal domain-containing protein [Bacteroidota bacterium]|nr:DPP IV N-terminal domain-containing protein [Bacteroidota bacterium]MXW13382.1 prolyl oligopeptidase family serine peptidase [Rhodothermaceae bacterium]MDE2646762.1 DPP IV N-terminal domain-containing protein [Bacteroidota bacterium]MXW33575.1 prolyl oligopeptidase family serine peptidase [Rhodothermaceae bacterium]MYC04583.1 prolyl oligopeptidase family serine peptidase [Rhodothermaceae bacterium]